MSDLPKQKRIYCNRCRGETWHHLVGSHTYEMDIYTGTYIMWVCAGCDVATMEDCFWASYMEDEQTESIFFPNRAQNDRVDKSFMNLPAKLRDLYSEVVNAYNSNLKVLCAIGLRGLIEGVCADKNIQGRNLDERVEAMTGLLPANIVQNLHGFRFMGNRAAHELSAPNSRELSVALDLIEDILNYLYDLDYKARIFATLTSSQKRTL